MGDHPQNGGWLVEAQSTERGNTDIASTEGMIASQLPNVIRVIGFRIRYLLVFFLTLFPLTYSVLGCSPKYGRHDPDQKQALRTLAGGVAGVLIAGNTGGAIIGAFVADVVSMATIKYEDRQLENGDQAARRYRDQEQKAEERKEQERKAEEKKGQERKAEELIDKDKKAEEVKDKQKKAEEMTDQERKAEERKEQERQAEKRKMGEKRVKLIIEDSSVETHTVRTGEPVKASIQYTLLAPDGTDNVRIIETRKLWTAHSTVELDSREITRTQGTYRSAIQFKMPEDLPRGYCILYTTVSDGRQIKTARSVMHIL